MSGRNSWTRKGRKRLSPDRLIPAFAFLEAGRVVGVHGVAGGIKVAALSGDPSGLLKARTLRLSGRSGTAGPEWRDFDVEATRRVGGCAVFSLKGIESVEAAREWVGARTFVPRADIPLGEDEYFVADLVGCAVMTLGGNRIGEVTNVVNGPAHDWLEVRRGSDEEFLLPIVSEFIREVDITGRRIVVSPPEGWQDAG